MQGIPQQVNAADSLGFTLSLAAYPASAGWSLEISVANAAQRYTFTSSASGDQHAVVVPSATTAGWAPGAYTITVRAKRGSGPAIEQTTLGAQAFRVLPDPFAAPVDGRSFARRALDAIEAVIEQRATRSDLELTINGRTVKHMAPADLERLRSIYKREVAAEERAAAIAQGARMPSRRVLVRFS
ncbi:hypothetical protein [Acidovorax lacteus]|uniref:Uncharacterized protein n=1 Tax=Acidovorax lacteus TaxID=1924988 RepID=A0ABP8KZM6_9BURK